MTDPESSQAGKYLDSGSGSGMTANDVHDTLKFYRKSLHFSLFLLITGHQSLTTSSQGERCYAVGGENQFHCILGGNSCYIVHPSDTAPPLMALGASVRVVGPRRTQTVPVEHFHIAPSQDPQRETVLEPDEIVTEILTR